jgi:hypothetical protein
MGTIACRKKRSMSKGKTNKFLQDIIDLFHVEINGQTKKV